MNEVDELVRQLRARASRVDVRDRLSEVLDGSEYVPTARTGRRPAAVLAVAGAVALIGLGVVVTGRSAGRDPVGEPTRHSFVTQEVSFQAYEFVVDVEGQDFTVDNSDVEVSSDSGDSTYQTLEVIWFERDVEMRLNIYFQSDGNQWWSNEIRTYNGRPDGDWVMFTGDYFRSPLGQPFTGDLDVTATTDGVTARLRIRGLRVHAFLAYGPGGMPAPTSTTTPPAGADPANAPARPADVPATGAAWRPNDAAALELAMQTLQHECMTARGWADTPPPDPDEMAILMGVWQPDPVLGIVGFEGARTYGYHLPTKNSRLEIYTNGLSEPDRARYHDDLTGSGSGCLTETRKQLPDLATQETLRGQVATAMEDAKTPAKQAAAVKSALKAWSDCVNDAVGRSEESPNDLARRFAFKGDEPSEIEKQVARADVRCQQQVDLWNIFHIAVADAVRSQLGDQVATYDELARRRVKLIANARTILSQRNITPPTIQG